MIHKNRNIDSELERKIDLYVDGRLDIKQVDELWMELVHNGNAMRYLKAAIDVSGIDDEEYVESIEPTTQNGTKIHWRLTATLVLIAGALFIFWIRGETGESVQPVTSIALNYYRSAADSISEDEAMLVKAIKLVNENKNIMAVRIIDIELSRTDDVHKRSLLLMQSGSILYNAASYQGALFRFKRVIKTTGIDLLTREKAYWYLGNTYFQIGELKAAKVAFQNAYDLDGAYRRVAEKYLNAFSG